MSRRWTWLLPLFFAVLFSAPLSALLSGCAHTGATLVYQRSAMFGVLTVIDEVDGTRAMRFGSNATQTAIRVDDPEHLQFDYLKLALTGMALAEAPRRVLIVGLGGGALPVFLRRHFPQVQIDVVEIDPEVVTAAKLYFGFREDAQMQAHAGDGRALIERAAGGSYDVVFLDAFGSAEVPPHLTTQEFLLAVNRALAPGGVVVSNLWKRLYNRRYDAMLRTYQDVFATVDVIGTARDVNALVLAQIRPLSREKIAVRVRELSQRQRFRFDLSALVETGLEARRPPRDEVPVLRDGGAGVK